MEKNIGRLERLRLYAQLTQGRAGAGGLPVARQLVEMIALLVVRNQGPGYYHAAGFWRPEISWRDKLAHMNAREYRRTVDRLNNLLYRKSSQHKLLEKALLTTVAIPTAPFIGYLHAKRGRDADGAPLTNATDLARCIRTHEIERFCIKPVEAWAGKDFRALDVIDRNSAQVRPLDTGATLSLQAFCDDRLQLDTGAGYVVESFLEQHEWYRALNPSSVNTLRLWVVQREGVNEVRLAYLRMGRAGSLVDNQSAGGLVAPINLFSGVLGAVIDGLPTRESWPCHPDSGSRVEGATPPMLNEAKSLAVEALGVFPHMRFAGVDVAVTPDGPSIIELNSSPDREGAAFTDVPTRTLFA